MRKSLLVLLYTFTAILLCQHILFAQAGWLLQNPSVIVGDLRSVSFTNADTGTVVGDGGTILRTTNGGASWTNHSIAATDFLNDVCFTDANIGIVGGDYGKIFRTTNGGASWTNQVMYDANYPVKGVSFTDANTGTVVESSGEIFRTTNGGASWTDQSNLKPYVLLPRLNKVSFTDANTGTAVGQNGTILHTTNGGAVWTNQSSGTTYELFGVSFTDANTGTAVGDGGTILRTANGGANWTIQSTGEATWLYGVFFTDANTGTAVGHNGTILRTTNGGTAVEKNLSANMPTGFSLMQNYPNPFNPSTNISFTLPSNSLVSLKVFDILGREVVTLVSEKLSTGNHFRQWNASALPSGVYFYRLQAGPYSETKKLLLLK